MGLFRAPSITTRADKITAFQATTCDFGTPLPLAYGTCKLAPNLINYQDFTAKEVTTTKKSGKAKQTSVNYRYNCYLEYAIAEGVINGIGKVWVGNETYESLASLNATNDAVGAPLSLNRGDNPNPTTYMTSHHPAIACGYENMAYLYGYCYLGENQASVPSVQLEVQGLLRNTGDGTDANPADIIIDMLGRIGLSNYIDTESFANYRSFCNNADLLVSTSADAFGSQKKVAEVIKELLDLTNAYMFWSVNKFKIVPRDDQVHGDWQPNRQIMYDLTSDDLSHTKSGTAMISFKRKDSNEVYNRFGLTFTNRANDYEQETVFFEDVADIADKGVKANSIINGKWFHTKTRAIKAVEMAARMNRTEVVEYTFALDWAFERLEPGDLVTLTDDSIGLDHQPVMIKSINFDVNGKPSVTAVRREPGQYNAAAFDVHEVDYNYINNNIEPSNTAVPLFIIPPVDLVTSGSGLEMWIALHGVDSTWGGCNVYISDKDGNYQIEGTQATSSNYGKIMTAMTEDSTEVTVQFSNPNTVELYVGSSEDAEKGNTLFWVNGECMSYSHAELLGVNRYKLTGIVRAQYGTSKAVHAINENMAMLDGSIYVVPLTKHYAGRELYFKFPAFNQVQGCLQDLNDIVYYTATANPSDLPDCTDIIAYNKYREFADDVTRYDVVVEWNVPQFDAYNVAQVWYKTNNGNGANMSIVDGMKASQIGYSDKWMFAGQGYDSVTIPQAIIGDTYRIAVCTSDVYGNVETPDSSPQIDLLIALKSEIPNTPANVGTSLTETFNIYWDEVRNADIKHYEIRTNNNVGVVDGGYIGKTTEHQFSTNLISEREGVVYVYAVSAYNVASAPAIVNYIYPKPLAPNLQAKAKVLGIQCLTDSIPNTCLGIHWYFEGGSHIADVVTKNATYYHSCEPDVYEVYAHYYDYFGDGLKSEQITVTVETYINPALIKESSITADKLNESTQIALHQATTAMQQAEMGEWWRDKLRTDIEGVYANTSYVDGKITDVLENISEGEISAVIQEKTAEYVSTEIAKISGEGGLLNDYYKKTETAQYVSSQLANYSTTANTTSLVNQKADSINTVVARLSKMASSETFNNVVKQSATPTVNNILSFSANTTTMMFYINVTPQDVYSISLYGGNSSTWNVFFTDASNKVICNGCGGLNYKGTTGKNGDNNGLATSTGTANWTKISDNVTVPNISTIKRMWLRTRCDSTAVVADVALWASVQKTVYSAITQLTDGIQLSVTGTTGNSSINLSQGTIALNTNLLQVGRAGALTSIADGTITTGMLKAGAVTADKMQVSSLSSLTATIGTLRTKTSGARLEIKDNLLLVYDSNNVLRVRLGVW